MPKIIINDKKIDFLLDEFIKNKVFHVILSGGEPLAKFDALCYALQKLVSNKQLEPEKLNHFFLKF